jgi:tetratricopeptide (TPR) repeat protein
MGAAHQQLGEIDRSRRAFEAALAVLETTRDTIGTGRALYNLGVLALNQARYEEAADYLERALPIIRSADIRHSHEIELDPGRYQNPIEVAALQALIEIYAETGDTGRAEMHKTALRLLQNRPKPAHSHPPRQP